MMGLRKGWKASVAGGMKASEGGVWGEMRW